MEPVHGKYRHYKGGEYEVLGIAKHTETLEDFVIYKAMCGDNETWVRPRSMFLETVDWEGQRHPRFRRVEEQMQAYFSLPQELVSAIGESEIVIKEARKQDPNAQILHAPLMLDNDQCTSKDIVPVIVASSAAFVAVVLALSHLLKTYCRRPYRCEWEELEEVKEKGMLVKGPSGLPIWRVTRKHVLLAPQQLSSKQELDVGASIKGVHFKFTATDDVV